METTSRLETMKVTVADDLSVSATLAIPEWWPTGARVGVVLAHDSTASMDQEPLAALQRALAENNFLTLRFNFPFAELGKKRPDPPALLERAFRAAVASLLPDPQNAPARLVLGGIGLGGRIAAQLVAQGAKTDGIVLLSFPLHPAGKPSQLRADALFRVTNPILFLQGTKDPTCRLDRLEALTRRIGAPTELRVIQDADHAMQPARGSPRTREEIEQELIESVRSFVRRVTGAQ